MEFTWRFDGVYWEYDVDDDALISFFVSDGQRQSTLKAIGDLLINQKDFSDICESNTYEDAMKAIKGDESLFHDIVEDLIYELSHLLEDDVLGEFEDEAMSDYNENYDEDYNTCSGNGVSERDFL